MKKTITILILLLSISLSSQELKKDSILNSIELNRVAKGYFKVWVDKVKLEPNFTKLSKAEAFGYLQSFLNSSALVEITQPIIVVSASIDLPIFETDTTDTPNEIDPGIVIPNHDLAFSTALGGGAYATGGRGGFVYHVTHLRDDNTQGSFRWALNQPRPATIIADVSGIILLKSSLKIKGDDLTIAFQSAPKGGITFTYPPNIDFYIDNPSKNIIARYFRARSQFDDATAFKIDSDRFGDDVSYANNIILDHISVSWAGLQGFTVRGRNTYNITFQNGLIAESKTGSLFGEVSTDHTGQSHHMTFARTHFYNVQQRTPNSPAQDTDIYNNTVINYKNRLSVFANGAKVNYFNNYTFKAHRTYLVSQYGKWEVNGGTNNASVDLQIYAAGNIIEDLFTDPLADNKYIFMEHAISEQKAKLDDKFFVNNPFPMVGYVGEVLTALESRNIVPLDAGANKYLNADGTYSIYRDEPDQRYITNTLNNTAEVYTCCRSGNDEKRHSAIESNSYKDFLASIDGVPINERPSNFYVSNPHIPEEFLKKIDMVGKDHNYKPLGSTQTLMDIYLSGVDYKENLKQ